MSMTGIILAAGSSSVEPVYSSVFSSESQVRSLLLKVDEREEAILGVLPGK